MTPVDHLAAAAAATRRSSWRGAAAVTTAGLGPFVFGALLLAASPTTATLNAVNLWIVYSIAALGFHLVFGMGGRFAFCHAFMIGLGAYSFAWAAKSHGFWIGLVVGVAVTAAVAWLAWLAFERLTDFSFAIATLALGYVGTVVFTEWHALGGDSGSVANIPAPDIFGVTVYAQDEAVWLLLGGLALALVTCAVIAVSPTRRRLVAARDDATVAGTLGIPVKRLQGQMFVLGSAMAGLGGVLLSSWQGFISVDSFSVDVNVAIFLIVMLGGKDSAIGPLLGAAVYVFLPDQLTSLQQYSVIIFGCLLIFLIISFPKGMTELGHRARERVSTLVANRRGKAGAAP
jgi:branched-chain amino acid transport system permease protein